MATMNDESEVMRADQDAEATAGAAAGATGVAAAAVGRKPKYPCLRCRKAVAKNTKAVKCNACDQWVHVECEQMSAEMYKIICDQE